MRIHNGPNRTLLEPFQAEPSTHVEVSKRHKNKDKVKVSRNRVLEFLNYGDLDITPERLRAREAEHARIEYVRE